MDTILQSAKILQKASVLWFAFCLVFSKAGQLYLQPSSQSQGFFTNDEFVVTCGIPTEENKPTRLTWRSPSGEIKELEGRIHVESESHPTHESLRLVIQGVRKTDEGEYICTAITKEEDDSTISFQLAVYRSIMFAGTPEEQTATEGDEYTRLLCHAKSDPEPSVKWIHNGSTLKTNAKYTATKTALTIHNVSRADSGAYNCKAILVTAHNSQIKQISIKLNVEYAPEWIEADPQDVYASLGTVGSLKCQAKSYPHPSFQWLKDGEVINSGHNNFNISTFENRSVLDIRLENGSLYGDYLCRVSNSLGTLEQELRIEEGERPDVPEVWIHGSSETTFLLEINEPGRNPLKIDKYVLQYKMADQTDWNEAKTLEYELGDPYQIDHLKADTEYVIRVAAKNLVGVGVYCEEIKHRTKTAVPATVRDQETDQQAPESGTKNGVRALFNLEFLHWATVTVISLFTTCS